MRILIVDDQETIRRAIAALLSHRADWKVCAEAVDGLDGVEKAKQLSPDLVLMDVSMPRMNGLEATRIIRRDLPHARVIIVTQNEPSVARQQAKGVDAHGFVPKSRLSEDLLTEIEGVAIRHEAPASPPINPHSPLSQQLFSGPGNMASLMRSMDWAATPLNAPEAWPPALQMMVRFMLPNPFPQLLWWGPQFCCLYNDAYIPILGAKHPWALGRPTAEVWHEIWHVLAPLVNTPFRGGPATWAEEIPLELNRSGFIEETHFTIAYSAVPDDTATSGIGGVLATVHEITEKVVGERRTQVLKDLGARSAEPRSAEEACAIAAQTLERYTKDIPFALFYLVDEDLANARFAGGMGVAGSSFPQTVALNDGQPWPFAKAINTEKIQIVHDLQTTFQTVPPGPWADPPTQAALIPIRSNKVHQPAGFAVIGISSRQQFDDSYSNFLDLVSNQISISIVSARSYEEERKRAEALAEIDRAKTAFFSNVSHEFRTPLTLMLGPIQDLLSRSRTHLTSTAAEQLELVNRNGARLLRLVNTLLDFSRIEAGRVKAVYQATDLAAVTAELAAVFRSATERAGLTLRVDCHATQEVAYVDRDMWEKIVLNLVSNAFKFTFEGEIAVSLTQVGHSAQLCVRDTGEGIPPEELPRLFDRFHRVASTRSRTHEGSGIGLALVHELVKLHGGSLHVDSTLGQGSAFFVSITLGQDHLDSGQIGGERSLASTATGATPFLQEALRWLPDAVEQNLEESPFEGELLPVPFASDSFGANRRRVLVADDNADMRQYLTRLLAEHYDVTAVPDGQAALDAIRRQRPDLLLSDIMMPNLDGFGLLRILRSDPHTNTVPVIFLSARAGEESRVDGLDAGADDYLIKPFGARELLARVQTHLALARVRYQADKLVRENEERLRAFVTASSDVVYRMSPDWTQMYYLRGKDLIPSTNLPTSGWLERYIPPEDQPRVLAAIHKAIASKSIFELEHRVLQEDGTLTWTFSRAVPLLDQGGDIIEWFGTASDVTARKLTEEELRDAQANLESRVKQRTEELERVQRDLRDLSSKLLQLQDEERRRIATELHDSAGQTLTVLAMSLAALAQLAQTNNGHLAEKVAEAQEIVQRLTQEIRTTSYLLHPPLLEEGGIALALGCYVEGLAERTGLKIDLDISLQEARLPHEIELAMFRIIQECLTNILRHSQSETAAIRIHRDQKNILLEVQDRGRGIPDERLSAINAGGSGVGIRGMRNRVRQLNGQMAVRSALSGTTISITLPVSADAPDSTEVLDGNSGITSSSGRAG